MDVDELDNGYTTPPEIAEQAAYITDNLLPAKSREKYASQYASFTRWKSAKNIHSSSENVLLAFFGEKSKTLKSSTLWSMYSMLRSTVLTKENVDISKYTKLIAFLKRHGDGYQPKKSKVLTGDQIRQFLLEAPDKQYLDTKVVLIFGILGACRTDELTNIKVSDIENHGELILVKIPNTKNKVSRSFTIHDKYRQIVAKYESLRPAKASTDRFFLNYRDGKCTIQVIGKNKFSNMPKKIAKYLNLPDAELYTGHSFRRTSATLLADGGADITALKRHGGWKSSSVAEGYVENSMYYKEKAAHQIMSTITMSSTSSEIIESEMSSHPQSANAAESEILRAEFIGNFDECFLDDWFGNLQKEGGAEKTPLTPSNEENMPTPVKRLKTDMDIHTTTSTSPVGNQPDEQSSKNVAFHFSNCVFNFKK